MASAEAIAHQEARAATAQAVAQAVLQRWSLVDTGAIAASWGGMLEQVLALIGAGQITTVQQAERYMAVLLGNEVPDTRLNPRAFAGLSPDGRPLPSLLTLPVRAALGAISAGKPLAAAMAQGAALLDMIARTVIADTGRMADQAAMVSNTAVTSYVRVVETPACARCIILAGREYSVSTGFLRHPRCDCSMEPVTRTHKPEPADPQALFDSMSPAERQRVFGEAGAKAIEDGADIARVVNARRGMATATVNKYAVTYEGTGRGKRKAPPRPMPETIYKLADSREEAIRLLAKHGYIY